ncbi:unnamed protein product, partial [Schistosoma rodhaini]|uniref:Uncharacterized protein n=1 Tax=Schistosoma rodhaini TaxID=6188 RepID=A0AA85GHK5_9TREM
MFMINQINQSIINLINKLSNKSILNYRLDISLYNKKSTWVAFYVLTDIALFFITIFVSQITVGKSAL